MTNTDVIVIVAYTARSITPRRSADLKTAPVTVGRGYAQKMAKATASAWFGSAGSVDG
jgi:hypothetical protein